MLQAQQEQQQQKQLPPQQQAAQEDQELSTLIKTCIETAKRISKQLALYLDDWELTNVAEHHTDRETGKIRLSRPQLRAGLLAVKKAPNPAEQAKRENELRWYLVEVLLHEAGHRQAVKERRHENDQYKEEVRNTNELIGRLITVLEHLNQAGDKTSFDKADSSDFLKNLDRKDAQQRFERIRTMILEEKKYRWKWLKSDPEGKGELWALEDRLNKRWKQVQSQIATLVSMLPPDQVKTNADAQVTAFEKANRETIARLEEVTGIKTVYSYDEASRQALKEERESGKFSSRNRNREGKEEVQHRSIPTWSGN